MAFYNKSILWAQAEIRKNLKMISVASKVMAFHGNHTVGVAGSAFENCPFLAGRYFMLNCLTCHRASVWIGDPDQLRRQRWDGLTGTVYFADLMVKAG